MVRNSIALQSGRNPAKATMRFYWKSKGGKPASFFRERAINGSGRARGCRSRGPFIIFLVRVHGSKSDLRFLSSGWKAVLVHNPGVLLPPGVFEALHVR